MSHSAAASEARELEVKGFSEGERKLFTPEKQLQKIEAYYDRYKALYPVFKYELKEGVYRGHQNYAFEVLHKLTLIKTSLEGLKAVFEQKSYGIDDEISANMNLSDSDIAKLYNTIMEGIEKGLDDLELRLGLKENKKV